jgi:TatD DNase family protein
MTTTPDRGSAQPDFMEYVDAHCHVDLFPDPASIVAKASSSLVHTIAVTNAPFVFAHTSALAQGRSHIYPALGLHPELVETHGKQLDLFTELLPSTRFVGEVGLDYTTTDSGVRIRQRHVFETILKRCAEAADKVITVHSRRATTDVIAAIGTRYPGTVILHWFTGSLRELDSAIAAGLMFSVNSAMLSSPRGRTLVQAMPRDRVLTESDGPFVGPRVAPESPLSIAKTIASLAGAWSVAPAEAAAIVVRNFRAFLSINSECGDATGPAPGGTEAKKSGG